MTATVALRKLVAEIVSARGSATADHIQLAFPHLTRRQIVNALCDARKEGHIHLAKKGRGPGHPGLWKPGGRTEAGIEPVRRVSSVFQLGNPLPESDWPKGWIGQVHRPLGEWNSTEEVV